jgi:hypothetical protein
VARKQKQPSVRIANPLPGQSVYTNAKSASRLVARGRAERLPDGSIRLFPQPALDALEAAERRKLADLALSRDIVRMRSGVIWWNGSDRRPNAMHRPGEVCS